MTSNFALVLLCGFLLDADITTSLYDRYGVDLGKKLSGKVRKILQKYPKKIVFC